MFKYLVLPLLFIFCIHTTQAQEFYKSKDGKKILTKTQLDAFLNNLTSNSKKSTFAITTSYTIVETIKRNDSVINIVEFTFEGKPTKNEKIYTLEHQPFPDFKLRNVEGKKVTEKDLKGKITFVNLWFVNCVPCRREMPLLNKLHKKYKGKVDFKSITYDSKESVKTFLKTNDYTFEHLVGATSFLKNKLGVQAYPKILIVNKDGIIEYIGPGIPPTFDKETKKVKDFTEDDLVYLETILDALLKK